MPSDFCFAFLIQIIIDVGNYQLIEDIRSTWLQFFFNISHSCNKCIEQRSAKTFLF